MRPPHLYPLSLLAVLSAIALVRAAACAPEPVNYALAANGGTVTGPRNSSASAALPCVVNDGRFDGYAWAFLDTPLVLRFSEPRVISTIDLLLYHEPEAWYQFHVEASLDGKAWTRLADCTAGQPRGWRRLDFAPTRCSQLQVTFTATNLDTRSYHVVELAAYLVPDPRQPTPLRLAWQAGAKPASQDRYQILLDCLGPQAVMSPEQRERVLALPPGQRLTTDVDGDGDPDLCDFVDIDPKHTIRPMLVRALDDDDDMGRDGKPDEDSDCYIADWRGDGRIDRAVDYWDEDGDGDADRMDLYYPAGAWHGDQVEVVVIRDIGDDNHMWWTRNYEYQQYACQWRSDFNDDEIFCMFGYDRASGRFLAQLEEPFTHHDLDGDGVAEMTIQFLGRGLTIATIRFSFDADNDSNAGNRRDYDFSFNCSGSLVVPEDKAITYRLRNGQTTGPSLDWHHARDMAEAGQWKTCRLCWDETDNNVNPADNHEREQERWEGVGGYPMREGNKRWETDKDYSGKMRLYYWPADRRLHLYGAETGYINIDYDHNSGVDAAVTYQDRDGDGFFDQWMYDANADGKPERVIRPPQMKCELVPIDYAVFVTRYRSWVQQALDEDEKLIRALKRALPPGAVSRYEHWWLVQRPAGFYAAEKLARSAEARRYYLDLTREELLLQGRQQFGAERWWPSLEAACEAGEYARAATFLPRPRAPEAP